MEQNAKNGRTLTWSQEFDGTALDKSIWTHEIGYIRNHELQEYTDRPENLYFADSCMVIEGRNDGIGRNGISSASVNTRDKYTFKYGYIEMRAKLPYGQGMWPAFWMMGEKDGWPRCGETDIMEMVGGTTPGRRENDSTVFGTLHYHEEGHKSTPGGKFILKDEKFADDFHTFGFEWTETTMKWDIDGEVYYEVDISASRFDAFRQPQYILVNLAIGGDWPGSPDETTVWPQRYLIDYLRVYQ